MKKGFVAFAATLVSLVVTVSASASGGDPPIVLESPTEGLGVTWVLHKPGSSIVDVYGRSGRPGSNAGSTDIGRLRATDNGVGNSWTFNYLIGGANTPDEEGAFMLCPSGSFCDGKAFVTKLAVGDVAYCDIAVDGLTTSNCLAVPTFKSNGGLSIVGSQLMASGYGSNAQVYSVNHLTGASTLMPGCSVAGKTTAAAGPSVNGFLYMVSNRSGTLGSMDLWRIPWLTSDCSGSATNLNSVVGYGNGSTAGGETPGAVDPLTGDMYYTKNNGTAARLKLNPSCGDGFISGIGEAGGEQCDAAAANPLNAQTCIGLGFTGGTLACNGSCQFNTSGCTSPPVCGNAVVEAGEVCDGSNFNGATCASINGAGWTGSLSCTGSCQTIGSGGCSPPAPICGDGIKNGTDSCDGADLGGANCSSVMGAGYTGTLSCTGGCIFNTTSCNPPGPVCGNGAKEVGEGCDGSDYGGATCASVLGAGYTGSLSCNACSINSNACVPPVTCGNGNKEGGEQCDGSDIGGATCASVVGAGYTGTITCNAGCTYNSGACSPPVTCGNGSKDGSEECDGADLGGATCASELGAGYIGSLSCNTCSLNTSACTKCGNSNLDSGEVCDGSLFGAKTCATEMGAGFTGMLGCNSSCTTVNTSGCTPAAPFCGDMTCSGSETCSNCPTDCGLCCGNGVINVGEACDTGNMGSATCSSLLGSGYTGDLDCQANCTYDTDSCSPPSSCGNGVLDDGEQCDGENFGSHSCASDKGEGYTGTLDCNECVIDTGSCIAPNWGVKVLSGGCEVVGTDILNAAIQTVNGTCMFAFVPKNGEVANNFWIEADDERMIPFKVAQLPSKSAFTIPEGIIWDEPDTLGNKKEFIMGAGVVMGDEGTGRRFDTKTSFPIVHFHDKLDTICFGKDFDYSKKFTDINVGNGVGCLDVDYLVDINVQTQTVTRAPWKEGVGGSGGSGGSSGTGGNAGTSGSNTGGSGGAGGGQGIAPPPAGGDDEGCSCAVPGREGIPFSGTVMVIAVAIASMRLKRRKN